MLGIIGKSADLSGSNSTLAIQDPSVGTTYSARSNHGLKSDDSVTVAADQSQVMKAGTKVNVFYLPHADKLGNDNTQALKLSNWFSFDTQVLEVSSDSATLMNTDTTLGSATTQCAAYTVYA